MNSGRVYSTVGFHSYRVPVNSGRSWVPFFVGGRGRKTFCQPTVNYYRQVCWFTGKNCWRGTLSTTGPLSWKVVRTRFRKYLLSAGLEEQGLTVHSIRHAAATHLLAHGAGVRYVQELLGHRSLKTTQIYTRPDVENIKAVYRTHHPRENRYYREPDEEYLKAVFALREDLLSGIEERKRKRERGEKQQRKE